LREVLDPKYGMFEYKEESHLIWFNPLVRHSSYSITDHSEMSRLFMGIQVMLYSIVQCSDIFSIF
jgi:hypothetical protein